MTKGFNMTSTRSFIEAKITGKQVESICKPYLITLRITETMRQWRNIAYGEKEFHNNE